MLPEGTRVSIKVSGRFSIKPTHAVTGYSHEHHTDYLLICPLEHLEKIVPGQDWVPVTRITPDRVRPAQATPLVDINVGGYCHPVVDEQGNVMRWQVNYVEVRNSAMGYSLFDLLRNQADTGWTYFPPSGDDMPEQILLREGLTPHEAQLILARISQAYGEGPITRA